MVNDYGCSPVHKTIYNPGVNSLLLLLNNKADPNLVDIKNQTPLHYSTMISTPNIPAVELLLSVNANPNLKDIYGDTPLHNAIRWCKVPCMAKVAQLLLQYGTHTNMVNNKDYTPSQLLAHKYSKHIDSLDRYSSEELPIARKMGRLLVWYQYILLPHFTTLMPKEIARIVASHVALLCAKQPTIWANKPVTLEQGFYYTLGNIEVLKNILAHKANPNMQDTDGYTSLHLAVNSKHLDYIPILLAAGADPNIENNYEQTPLHVATSCRFFPTPLESIQLLLNANANPNCADSLGTRPLHNTLNRYVSPQIVECLLSAKANPNLKNINGWSPLHKAAIFGPNRPEMIKAFQLLLQYRAPSAEIDIISNSLLSYQHLNATLQEKPIILKIGRQAVWHYLISYEFGKLVFREIAHIIASHVAAICAEQPTIWTKKLLPAAPALTKEQSSSSCQLI